MPKELMRILGKEHWKRAIDANFRRKTSPKVDEKAKMNASDVIVQGGSNEHTRKVVEHEHSDRVAKEIETTTTNCFPPIYISTNSLPA